MQTAETAQRVIAEVKKAIAGQDRVIEFALIGILANGHVLLEGVPGVAKTLLIRTLSRTLDLEYGRVQFTPDLMPSDVIGTNVFDPKLGDFRLRKGPVFVNILLADEINRTPPKTQAALLEAMEERQSTIDGETYPLPPPFIVFATQNPIDFEGTYPLPEAQQDRFLLKILVGYPEPVHEIQVLRSHHAGFRPQSLEQAGIQPVVTAEELRALQAEVAATKVEDRVFDYIQQIVSSTRSAGDILVGASPRAGIALLNTGKALARIRDRDYVIPDDIKELALPVLRHRILLRPEAEVEGLSPDQVLTRLLDGQTVPR
ncbi:MAG: MoxR family ATPase [Fimbriimonadaceae bacterium]|nr:MoxR family ATPase [Fimbriimonadaceae bacterium]